MFAMTTTQAIWVLDYDTASAWQIDCGKGVYYGLSFWDGHLYVAARQARVGGDRDIQKNVILCYGSDLRLEQIIKPPAPIRDVHQIIAADGIVYVASSYDDQIACYDIEKKQWSFLATVLAVFRGRPGYFPHQFDPRQRGPDISTGTRPKGWVAHSRSIYSQSHQPSASRGQYAQRLA